MMTLDPKHPGPTSCTGNPHNKTLGSWGVATPFWGNKELQALQRPWWMQVARQVGSKRHLPIWPRTAPGKPLA